MRSDSIISPDIKRASGNFNYQIGHSDLLLQNAIAWNENCYHDLTIDGWIDQYVDEPIVHIAYMPFGLICMHDPI